MGRIALKGGAFASCLYACSVAAASRVKWSEAFAKRSLDALGEDSTYDVVVVQLAATLALGEWMVAVLHSILLLGVQWCCGVSTYQSRAEALCRQRSIA